MVEQQPSESPVREPSPEHRKLEVFVGTWRAEGQQKDGPFGPSAPIRATQTWEWLTGKLFLVLRFEGKVGDAPAACIEVTGYDSVKRSYPTHTFYNDGNSMQWRLHERGDTWIRTGALQQHGKTIEVRCTTLFNESRDTMTARWEFSNNRSAWQTFWEIMATRTDRKR